MQIDIVSLFPRMFDGPLSESILKRAREAGQVTIRCIDLREFATDRHRSVDDRPYGGGAGMVLMPGPVFRAVEALESPRSRVILLTPQGKRFEQTDARRLARDNHLILLCGHYEGLDERIRQTLVDEEISIGDFVLTNGSLAAMAVTDAVVRLLPGVLGSSESVRNESFGDDRMLEYPQYTRPAEFRGMRVPDVLLSGDHKAIERWRVQQQKIRTRARRPDLLQQDGEEQ